jgi:hypothetical protein
MQFFFLSLILAGCFPIYRAWLANRQTSLTHAVLWAGAAWFFWGIALIFGTLGEVGFDPLRYIALCMTGAAGVAVLGARRPHVGAWDFVVLGLLAVLLLPLAEKMFLGTPALGWPRVLFLGATLAVGILNYVPTAFALPALLLGVVSAGECFSLFATDPELRPEALIFVHLGLLSIPWMCWWCGRRHAPNKMAINQIWLDFRDRFGLFWGQRVREQYNRSAHNAELPGYLFWRGWKALDKNETVSVEQLREMETLLQALLKRFSEREALAP